MNKIKDTLKSLFLGMGIVSIVLIAAFGIAYMIDLILELASLVINSISITIPHPLKEIILIGSLLFMCYLMGNAIRK